MHKSKHTSSELVFTGHAWEAEMVRTVLENEGIQAFINNEHIGTLLPFYSTPGMGAVRVVVSAEDAEKARQFVAEFEKNRFA